MTQYQLPHMGGSTISTRLTTTLLDELRKGDFMHCDRLPSEIELAERYGVSRSVIRDMLSNLEREGFVERGRGIGTLIHREIVNLTNRLDVKFAYNDFVRGRGGQPSCDSVLVYEKPADVKLAERLEIAVDSAVIVCEKRILADGQPVIYFIDHLPVSLFSHMDYRTLDWSIPIYDLLDTYCGITIDSDIAKIAPVIGSPSRRACLQVPEEEALLFIDEVGYYKLSRPIVQSNSYYTTYFDFTLLRKKV